MCLNTVKRWDIDAVTLDKSISSVSLCVCLSTWYLFLGRVLNSLFGNQLFCFMFMHCLERGDAGLWWTPFSSGDKDCWCTGEKATSWMWLLSSTAHLPVMPCSFKMSLEKVWFGFSCVCCVIKSYIHLGSHYLWSKSENNLFYL